jgi:hypothetical protein
MLLFRLAPRLQRKTGGRCRVRVRSLPMQNDCPIPVAEAGTKPEGLQLPTINFTISSGVVSDGLRLPEFSPRRNTTILSATSKMSRRL